MIKSKTITILGGDLRQAYLANSLASKEMQHKIYGMFLNKNLKLSGNIHTSDDIQLVLPQSDIVVFPLPLLDAEGYVNTPSKSQKISLCECLSYLSPEAIVLAGKVTAGAAQLFKAQGIECIDYLEREEFAVLNAVPTAEGAIEIALRELPITLMDANCLVTGYGRIAKVLIRLLLAFGAKVTVAVRSYSDLAWIRTIGCEGVHISEMGSALRSADLLINTVPAVLLDESKLKKLSRDCLVIDLASKPGGVDFETAKTLGIKTIWALSLPGIVAPITASDITLHTILNILCERGVLQ